MRKHFFNERYFENIDTEEKAYWLGFISADGCISKPSEFSSRLCLSQSITDKNIWKNLNMILEQTILKLQLL